jgi:hypothetical protein
MWIPFRRARLRARGRQSSFRDTGRSNVRSARATFGGTRVMTDLVRSEKWSTPCKS